MLNKDQQEEGCDTYPCMYGGTCIDTAHGYKCKCLPGFKGKNCDCGELHGHLPFCVQAFFLMQNTCAL